MRAHRPDRCMLYPQCTRGRTSREPTVDLSNAAKGAAGCPAIIDGTPNAIVQSATTLQYLNVSPGTAISTAVSCDSLATAGLLRLSTLGSDDLLDKL